MYQINPLRYRGYYYDSESGLYYLQSRYYDPITCRFISADIVDADISDESLFVTMKFVTEQSNVLKDKNGKIIEGTEDFLENRTDTWTFFRKKFAVDNKWFLYELKQD